MNRQTILIVIFAVMLLGAAYFWFSQSNTTVPPEKTGPSASEETAVQLAQLRRLRGLRLDTAVLEDAFFKSLSSIQGLPVVQENERGKINPFLPF